MNAPTPRRFWAQETATQHAAGWAVAGDPADQPPFHATGDMPGATGLARALTAIQRALEHCQQAGITHATIICANREAVRFAGRRSRQMHDVPRDCRPAFVAIQTLKEQVTARITRHVKAWEPEKEVTDSPLKTSTWHWVRAMQQKLIDHMPKKGGTAALLTFQTDFWKREAARAVKRARELHERGNPARDVSQWLERATAAAKQTGLVNGSQHPLISLGLITNTTHAN